MASAVIRAMSFGALSTDDRGRGRSEEANTVSRSSSKNRYSKQLSRESTLELDDSLGLERSLSRLSLVSSASGARAPGGGILINRSRPSSPQPPTTRSLSYEAQPSFPSISTSVGSSSSLTDRTGRPLPPIRTHSSASTVGSSNEPLTPSSPGFVVMNPPPLATSSTREESIERKPKIKFAPLPQIRPRSYSTGRNVWAEHDQEGGGFDGDDSYAGGGGGEFAIDDEGNENPLGSRHLVRREDGRRISYDDDGLDDSDDYESEEEGGGGKFNPRRQSWTDTLGMGSVWGNLQRQKSREIEEDAVSLGSSAGNTSDYGLSSSGGKEKESGGVSKILKPFLFGRKKSVKGASRSTVTSNVDEVGTGNGGAGLSRQSSGESRLSISNETPGPPTPTNQGTRPKGTTGIPMRKASTWDSTNSNGSNRTTTTKKTQNRNSVASPPPPPSSLPRDPSTPQIIYYASPSRSARPARRAQYPPVAQRSRTAPKPIRQSKVEEPEFSEWGSVGSVGSVASSQRKSAADEDEDGSGMAWIRRRRKEREEKEKRDRELALEQGVTSVETKEPEEVVEEKKPEEDKENEVVQRAIGRTPKRQSTVDSTFSVTSSTSTIRPASPKVMSGLSLSRPVETVEPEEELGQDSPEPESDEEDLEADVDDDEEEEEDEDEEEEEEKDEVEKEEDDDLDAEELAAEEALCDAARRTASSAGAERYHSTKHENVLHVPSDTVKRQPSQTLKRNNSNGSSFA